MGQMNQLQVDEIDLLELFKSLWYEKWIIVAFTIAALILGNIKAQYIEPKYESKIFYSIDTLPPFYVAGKAESDFIELFYSASTFNNWKKNKDTKIVYQDISITEPIDGYNFSKVGSSNLAVLKFDDGVSWLSVRTDDLKIIDDFNDYANHVNEELQLKYITRAKDELKFIQKRFEDSWRANIPTKELLSLNKKDLDTISGRYTGIWYVNAPHKIVVPIDRYILEADSGAKVFNVESPTQPYDSATKKSTILVISGLLGLTVGIFFIAIRYLLFRREDKITEV